MHPILFDFGFYKIYTYGFLAAAALLTGYFLFMRLGKLSPFPKSGLSDWLFVSIICGWIGARAFFVIQHWEWFEGRWMSVFFIHEGGLVWYGGFIVGALVGFGLAHAKKWKLLAIADLAVPALAVGHGIGRIGCFFNGCCGGVHGYPVQLWEAAFLILLGILLARAYTKPRKDGMIFSYYLFSYGAFRFMIEFFRVGQEHIFSFTIPQWISLGLVLIGLIGLMRFRKN